MIMDNTQGGEDGTAPVMAAAGASAGECSNILQTRNADGPEWQEEVYHKIKSMKEMYLAELNDLYQKIASKVQQHDSHPQRLPNEQIEKLRLFKIMLERIGLFLRMNKQDIQPSHKEKLVAVEKHISFFLSSSRPRSNNYFLQQNALQLPKQHEQQMLQNQQSTPLCNQLLMQQQLFQNQQLMQQNPVNSPQQVNISSLSSQSGTIPAQANLGSLQQNSSVLQQMLQNQQQQMQQLFFQRQQLMQLQQMGMKTGVLYQQQSFGQRVASHTTAGNMMHQQATLPMEFEPYTSTVEVPTDSSAQTRNANGADWQEEVYQKIKSLREMHLSELNDLYWKIDSKVQKSPQHELIEKLKTFKTTLEHIVLFLWLNKHEIQLSHKEKLLLVEKHISLFLSGKRPHKPTSSPLQGQLPQPSIHIS